MKICQNCGEEFDDENWVCPACVYRPTVENGFYIFSPDCDHHEAGFNPEIFDSLFQVEKHSFWFRVRNQIIGWAIKTYFRESKSFLEIGCGTGFVLSDIEAKFPHLNCAGSELQSRGLVFSRKRIKRASLWQMDARNIPFHHEFDVIGAFDVLEHIEDDECVLLQINKALRPGGGVLLTVPQHPFLWSAADEYAHHERRYTLVELKRKLESAGFHVKKSSSFVTLLLPILMTSRLVNRFSKADYDHDREFNLPSWLDLVFEKIMQLEFSLIRRGFSLPIGGSLLLIAYKIKES